MRAAPTKGFSRFSEESWRAQVMFDSRFLRQNALIRPFAGFLAIVCADCALAGTSDPAGVATLVGLAILAAFVLAGGLLTFGCVAGFGGRVGVIVGLLWFVGIPTGNYVNDKYQDHARAKEEEGAIFALTAFLRPMCADPSNEQILNRASNVLEIEYEESLGPSGVRGALSQGSGIRPTLRVVRPQVSTGSKPPSVRYVVKVENLAIRNVPGIDGNIEHQRISVIDRNTGKQMAVRNMYWSPRYGRGCGGKPWRQEVASIEQSFLGVAGADFVLSVLVPKERADILASVTLGPNERPYVDEITPRVEVSWKDEDTRFYAASDNPGTRLPERVMYFTRDPASGERDASIAYLVDDKMVQVNQRLGGGRTGKVVDISYDGKELGVLVYVTEPESALLFRRFDAAGRTLQNSKVILPAENGYVWSRFGHGGKSAESSAEGHTFYVKSSWEGAAGSARLAIHVRKGVPARNSIAGK